MPPTRPGIETRMKRSRDGKPIPDAMMHQWSRPPLSCSACRAKKRRCDRAHPCSNCTQRNMTCEYPGQSTQGTTHRVQSPGRAGPMGSQGSTRPSVPNPQTVNQDHGLLTRICALEKAMYQDTDKMRMGQSHQGGFERMSTSTDSPPASHLFSSFGSHQIMPDSQAAILNAQTSMAKATRKLPPIGQARILFDHFAKALQPSLGLLHIPSTRSLIEQTYQDMLDNKQPTATTLMLLFSIFSGAALVWSGSLLEILSVTQAEARSAFHAYSQEALFILEHPTQPLKPSTNALVATCILTHSLANDAGLSVKMRILQVRCFSMAQELRIHRVDTARSQEGRRLKGCNMIEIEVQRRVWWNMVASDWLSSFSGGSHEGVYIFQTKHMNVNYPSNVDDELMVVEGVQQDFPLSVPTAMSGCIQRIRTAVLCREVVDAMPSILLDSQKPEYEVILALDKKFHDTIEDIPEFFKMDAESLRKNQALCRERPYIAWQRISLHFSFHSRLCRLHRPYHLEGITNPAYAYSNRVCVQSAKTVLELRRAMDEISPEAGGYPARLWRVVQHLFSAALILATNVSFNPEAPEAETLKANVLAAHQTLEKSENESGTLFEGIQRNMQTLLSTLRQRPGTALQGSEGSTMAPRETEPHGINMGLGEVPGANDFDHRLNVQDPSAGGDQTVEAEENWQQIWLDFVAVAPDLDVPQWNSLLDDVTGWTDL